MKRYIVSCSVLLIMSTLLYACTKEKPQPAAARGYAQQKILMGLIPEQSVFRQRVRYFVLKQYLDASVRISIQN